jgi:methyltransferase (TIGR00027 family)
MLAGQFSRTALGAAGHRAAHQILEGGRIFVDPLALRILGDDAETALARAAESPGRAGLRQFIAIRSRVAEAVATGAIADGARQVVVLGAGLDTFAYRVAPVEGLRVFEVDHPATQAEKRRRLAAADIAAPAHLTFAPCDFETAQLDKALRDAGFNERAPSVFLWLGVTPYLTREAVVDTLALISRLPGPSEVVFDYANPPESIADPDLRRVHETLAARVAEAGESFRCYFDTIDLHAILRGFGFAEIDDLGPREIAAQFFPSRASPARENGGHVIRAAR